MKGRRVVKVGGEGGRREIRGRMVGGKGGRGRGRGRGPGREGRGGRGQIATEVGYRRWRGNAAVEGGWGGGWVVGRHCGRGGVLVSRVGLVWFGRVGLVRELLWVLVWLLKNETK